MRLNNEVVVDLGVQFNITTRLLAEKGPRNILLLRIKLVAGELWYDREVLLAMGGSSAYWGIDADIAVLWVANWVSDQAGSFNLCGPHVYYHHLGSMNVSGTFGGGFCLNKVLEVTDWMALNWLGKVNNLFPFSSSDYYETDGHWTSDVHVTVIRSMRIVIVLKRENGIAEVY